MSEVKLPTEEGDLEPCPFCGSNAYEAICEETDNRGGHVIQCSKCYASTRVFFGEAEGLKDAWNNRVHSEAAKEKEIERQRIELADQERQIGALAFQVANNDRRWDEIADERADYKKSYERVVGEVSTLESLSEGICQIINQRDEAIDECKTGNMEVLEGFIESICWVEPMSKFDLRISAKLFLATRKEGGKG